jgi:hypothetical protein
MQTAPFVVHGKQLGGRQIRQHVVVLFAAGITTFTYRILEKGISNPGTPANPRSGPW